MDASLCAVVCGVLSGTMFGLGTHDPIAFVSVPLFLLAVGFIATFMRARKAIAWFRGWRSGVNEIVALDIGKLS